MFDIGFFELLVVAVVALLVVGPERLPDAIRTTARWWSALKRTLHSARDELEKEVGADDIRRELHNERILREIEESRREMEQTFAETNQEITGPLEQQARETASGTPLPKGEPTQTEAAEGTVPAEPTPTHPRAEKEDYLPEQDETAEELQDPEYPEHWHDFGDPDMNPDHPENIAQDTEKESQQEKDSQP
ncbi:Sec-independent protein translocase protein TatB [Microbulbifer sp. 2304DJ12-6]|uniref:Sec-independent protein translocase protein TatB n=1 Tax=Microbulbifer sp. 2304DJ12-6 TaxID=3233340 RepID=UPI0039AEBE17